MYKQCTTEITSARQRKLEYCLLDLLQSNSYEHITVQDICTLAQVPRGMFYRYFDSKKDALDALKRNHMESALFERSIRYCTVEEPLLPRHLKLAGNPADMEVVAFCINGVISAIFVWYESGFAKSTEEMARILQKLLTGPVVTP